MAKVTLKAESLGVSQEFDLKHAQDILDFEKKIQCPRWELDDKHFTLDSDGRIIKSNRKSQEAQEHSTDSGSNKAN